MPPRKTNSTKPKRNNAPKAPRAPKPPSVEPFTIAFFESAALFMNAQTEMIGKLNRLLDLAEPIIVAGATAAAMEAEKATGPVADA